jgi:hypothetical protein
VTGLFGEMLSLVISNRSGTGEMLIDGMLDDGETEGSESLRE